MSFPQLRSRGIKNNLAYGSVAQYTIEGGSGEFTWTGTVTGLVVARKITADSGSYAWSGTAASLNKGATLAAASGSFTWSGTAADLERTYLIVASAASFAWAGVDATLVYSDNEDIQGISFNIPKYRLGYPRAFHPGHSKPFKQTASQSIAASSGSFEWTGSDVTLSRTYAVAANTGEFLWSGTNATLTYSAGVAASNLLSTNIAKYRKNYPRAFHPGHSKPFRVGYPQNYSLGADSGSYAWTGEDTSLTVAQLRFMSQRPKGFKVWPRPFAPSPFGQLRSSRNLNRLNQLANPSNQIIVAESGNFTWNGTDVALVIARKISAESGSFSWTGTNVTLRKGHTLLTDAGSFAWTGVAATLLAARTIDASSGTITWTGAAATLKRAVIMGATAGAFDWTGTDASLEVGRVIDAEDGEFIFSFGDAGLLWSAQPGTGGGRMTLMGVG